MKKFIVLAGVIPLFDDKILITQRSFKSKFLPGNWGLPCGKIDFGEDVEEAALRELKEETGLTGKIIRIVGTSKFVGTKGDDELHNVQINYLVNLQNDNVILDDSTENFRWININDFENSELDEFNKNTIRQIFNGSNLIGL